MFPINIDHISTVNRFQILRIPPVQSGHDTTALRLGEIKLNILEYIHKHIFLLAGHGDLGTVYGYMHRAFR